MGLWEFLTVAVIFGTTFGYLKARRGGADKARLDALERRLAALEQARPDADLASRVDVLEQIVVVEDRGLASRIDALSDPARAQPRRGPEASAPRSSAAQGATPAPARETEPS